MLFVAIEYWYLFIYLTPLFIQAGDLRFPGNAMCSGILHHKGGGSPPLTLITSLPRGTALIFHCPRGGGHAPLFHRPPEVTCVKAQEHRTDPDFTLSYLTKTSLLNSNKCEDEPDSDASHSLI